MQMGKFLLQDLNISLESLTHKNFETARQQVEEKGEGYFDRAVVLLETALQKLYGFQEVSPLRLSATFRRGDLLEYLPR